MASRSTAIDPAELLANMGWVRGLALALVRDPDVAEDVAQDTWLSALERPPRRASGPALRAWLAAVVRTLARQSARSQRRRERREHAVARPEAQASTVELVARAALHRRVVGVVMDLEEPYRSTLLLRHLDGIAAPRIAQLQGVSPAAVRKRISRGLMQLRARLDAESGGDRAAWSMLLAGPLRPPAASSTTVLGGLTMAKGVIAGAALKLGLAAALALGLGYSVWVLLPERPAVPPPVAPGPQAARTVTPPASPDAQDAPRVDERVVATQASTATESTVGATSVAGDTSATTSALLDAVAGSFLTEDPDLEGFQRVVGMLARLAEVDEGSVHLDPDDGSTRGTLIVAGMDLEATFRIAEGRYHVTLGSTPDQEGSPFFRRDLTLSFADGGGWASHVDSGIQYHPDTRRPSSSVLQPGTESFVGWVMSIGSTGTHAQPITMQAAEDGKGWRIGHAEAFEPIEQPWARDTSSYGLWLDRLRGLGR